MFHNKGPREQFSPSGFSIISTGYDNFPTELLPIAKEYRAYFNPHKNQSLFLAILIILFRLMFNSTNWGPWSRPLAYFPFSEIKASKE